MRILTDDIKDDGEQEDFDATKDVRNLSSRGLLPPVSAFFKVWF